MVEAAVQTRLTPQTEQRRYREGTTNYLMRPSVVVSRPLLGQRGESRVIVDEAWSVRVEVVAAAVERAWVEEGAVWRRVVLRGCAGDWESWPGKFRRRRPSPDSPAAAIVAVASAASPA